MIHGKISIKQNIKDQNEPLLPYQEQRASREIWCSHSSVEDDSSLQGYNVALTGK